MDVHINKTVTHFVAWTIREIRSTLPVWRDNLVYQYELTFHITLTVWPQKVKEGATQVSENHKTWGPHHADWHIQSTIWWRDETYGILLPENYTYTQAWLCFQTL